MRVRVGGREHAPLAHAVSKRNERDALKLPGRRAAFTAPRDRQARHRVRAGGGAAGARFTSDTDTDTDHTQTPSLTRPCPGHGELWRDQHMPRLLESLKDTPVVAVGAAWSSSFVVTAKGELMAAGCGFHVRCLYVCVYVCVLLRMCMCVCC